MKKVITQNDIIRYAGMKRVELPEGTLLTPSAKDWAQDHGLEVLVGTGEREKLLELTINSVLSNADKAGGLLTRKELVTIVTTSLEKMGCIVENK